MRYLLLPVIILIALLESSAQSMLIKDINIVDVVTGEIISHQDIRIEDGYITEIGSDIKPSDDLDIVEGTSQYLMPGLIDAHIHLFQSGGLYTRPDAIDLTAIRSYSDERQWLRDHAAEIMLSYLSVGVTSVVDVGGPMYQYDERDRLSQQSELPSLFMTGPLISTYLPPELDVVDPPIVKVSTANAARELVKKQVPLHPDFIKIWYIALPTQSAETTYDIVKATIDEASKHDLPVAVHATQLNTAKLAIKAGASVLVHSVSDPIDDEFIDMLINNQVVYIPTLAVHGNYNLAFTGKMEFQKEDFDIVSPTVIGSLQDVHHIENEELEQMQQYANLYIAQDLANNKVREANLAILAKTDVVIATGTDAGNIGTLHASSYIEEVQAMRTAGMTDAQIVKSSTIGAAKATGKRGEVLGEVKVGKKADLLILEKNPLEDIIVATSPMHILKNGIIVDQRVQYNSSEELVQLQLNAYNSRDIEAFLLLYADDVEVYTYPNNLRYKGKEEMRKRYTEFFSATPDLHCKLVSRTIDGNVVTDQEYVTGLIGDRAMEATAIYHIEDGKIAKVYFK